MDISHYSGTAAHVGHLGIVIPLLVELEIKWGIQEGEIRKQPLGRGADGLLEQVEVRIMLVVVNTFLNLENLNREYRGFTIAQPCSGGL